MSFIRSSFNEISFDAEYNNFNEWEYFEPYPEHSKLYIPGSSLYVQDKWTIHFRCWISESDNTNIISRSDANYPEFWFGVYDGKLTFSAWPSNDYTSRSVVFEDDIENYLNKWLNITLVRLNDNCYININNTWYTKNIGGYVTYPVYNKTNIGINGKIKDLIFINEAAYNIVLFNSGGFEVISSTVGLWLLTNNRLYDLINGNDAVLTSMSAYWDNNPTLDATASADSWKKLSDYKLLRQCARLRRSYTDEIGKVTLGYKEDDPNDIRNYTLDTENLAEITSLSDTVAGAEFTISKTQHLDTSIELYTNKELSTLELDGVTPKTIPAGTKFTENVTSVSSVNIVSKPDVVPNHLIDITFDSNLNRRSAVTTNLDEYTYKIDDNRLYIYTDDVGIKDLVISGLEDEGFNPLGDISFRVVIQRNIEKFVYNGREYEVKDVYVDTFEDKVARDLLNALEDSSNGS